MTPRTKAGTDHIETYGGRFDQWERQTGEVVRFRKSALAIENEMLDKVAAAVERAESPSLSWPGGLYPSDAVSRAALLAAIEDIRKGDR